MEQYIFMIIFFHARIVLIAELFYFIGIKLMLFSLDDGPMTCIIEMYKSAEYCLLLH